MDVVMNKNLNKIILTLLFIILAYILSVSLRLDSFLGIVGAQNLEATYHVLWTMTVLKDTTISSHWLLPAVTLHPSPGGDYLWGSTVPTAEGNYIYTSFPPLGFLIPLIALWTVGAPIDLLSLAIFNSFVGLLTAIAFGALCTSVAVYADRSENLNKSSVSYSTLFCYCFVSSTVIYLFLRESLHSHGAVYWHHSISQLVFVLSSWLAFRQFTYNSRSWERYCLVVLCVAFPLLEWTGYIFNIGLCLAFAFRNKMRLEAVAADKRFRLDWSTTWRLIRGWPLLIGIVTIFAGLVYLIHLIASLGLQDTFYALASRAEQRSGIHKPLRYLIAMPFAYWASVAALAPLGLAAAFVTWRRGLLKPTSPLFWVLAITVFPLLENALMLQHAYQFSFDRLKIAVPLGVALFACVGSLPSGSRAFAGMLTVMLILATNVMGFVKQQASYSAWPSYHAANQELVTRLRAQPEAQCAQYGADNAVRGYLNLLLMRDIYEKQDVQLLSTKGQGRPSCGLVLLRLRFSWRGLPSIEAVEIYSRSATLIKVLTPVKERAD